MATARKVARDPHHDEIVERLVRAEEGVKAVAQLTSSQHQTLLDAINGHGNVIALLETKHDARIQSLEDSLTRYKGAWGAVTIVFSAVAVAWEIFGDWLKRKILGG